MSPGLSHYLLPPLPSGARLRRVWPLLRVSTLATFYGSRYYSPCSSILMLSTAVIWRDIARRHASWFNFMVTWIISCSIYLFLIGKPLGQPPGHTLCLLQAALVYSVPSLTSGATIALVIHVYITLYCLLTATNRRASWTAALLIGPYCPAWAMFILALRIGLTDPSVVQRPANGTYCSMTANLPGRVSAIVVAILMILCLGVEAMIFRNLRRAWETLKQDNRGFVSTTVRVLAFTLVGMLSIILSLIFLALPSPDDHDAAFNVVIAIVPVSSVLIFGTQKDIFTAWCSVFRRKPHGVDTWETFTSNESRQTM
ncbi:hypothetical protein C8R44DRAFT_389945 [Mycena epipterygia]|nr:hypothetical protein C8R44DRAFT_389945 [Mycena epipterygia]